MGTMTHFARLLSVLPLALGLVAVGGPADAACPEPGQGPPGCHTGPVPDKWGEPTWEHATVVVVAHQNQRLPGRLGNQHVTEVGTVDEESVINGVVHDWFCPAGAVAPDQPTEASRCRLRTTRYFEYDYDYDWPGAAVMTWAPNMRYVNLRLPIRFYDPTSTTVTERGWLSLRLKGFGAPTQSWYDGDYVDLLSWDDGASVVGGHFMGKAWLAMDSVRVDA